SCRTSGPVGENVEECDLGRMRATRGGNQGTSEGNVSRPGSRLYPDSEPAIESGCCNAEQSRRRERQTNGEFDGRPGGATDRTTRFLPLPPLRIPASDSEALDEPASSGGDRDR